MSEFLERIGRLSPERLALLAAELKQRLDRVEGEASRAREPLAIVGIGCRFPGGIDGPDAFWEFLARGGDAVTEVPADRWDVDALYDPDPDRPGTMATRWGAFLDDVAGFDADFFGIAPREALSLDPQQRILLEVVWEALEHAAIPAPRLDGSETGVFVGLCNHDYSTLLLGRPYEQFDGYLSSGNAGSMAAGRIAYAFGLQGPALVVDTACSSSLVAIHLAAESLRRGECRTAIAGGASLILAPDTMIGLTKAHMLAPDGRCRTFDAEAAGIVRGEGVGVVVLKRLADAQADGDRILALIRGSAMNQDGRSSGITAPNGPAQEALMRRTLEQAGVRAHEVGYVEAHGTGTRLGDPIEVRALASVYAAGRDARDPLRIGSVKTNLGHTEAAAGVAGLIKAVLALRHGALPPHLHLRERNPLIEWERWPIEIPDRLTPWPAAATRRLAAVSSFGFSGTNAHVVLEEAPERADPGSDERPVLVLPLSARSPAALAALAARVAGALRAPDADGSAIAHTAATGRAPHAHRVAVSGRAAAELAAGLEAFTAGSGGRDVARGEAARRGAARVAFLFTGQGAQAPGMGRELFRTSRVYRETLERCDALLRPLLDVPLLDLLHPSPANESRAAILLSETARTQPALFAVEFALAETWRSWGIHPAAVIGHSLGEYVAATVAGLFTLEDALRLAAERGRLMQSLPAGGAMAAVLAPLEAIEDRAQAAGLSIAAINGPANTVVSGPAAAVAALTARLSEEGIEWRALVVSHAFHSALVEPVLPEFERIVAGTRFGPLDVPLVSNVTGAFVERDELADPEYWVRHMREPVRFADGMRTLAGAGYRHFLEVGPHPTLLGMASACIDDEGTRWLPSLRRGHNNWQEMVRSLAGLWVSGAPIDWEGFHADRPRRPVTLPTYPFQRTRYWPDDLGRRTRSEAPQPSEEGSLWCREWEPAPVAATAPASPAMLAAALEGRAEALIAEHGAAVYESLLPRLDALCAALVAHALTELGATLRAGARVEEADLHGRLGIRREHARLARRMLAILEEDGVVRRRGEGWLVTGESVADAASLGRRLLADFPSCAAEIELTLHCGHSLAAVLRGEADPMEVLFPGGSLAPTERLYGDAPAFRAFNALLAEAVASALPAAGPCRILEVGAGTGGATAAILPVLPADRTRYVFTDVSVAFLHRGRERFAGFDFVEYGTLDLTRDPGEAGFEAGSFDLVIASNVLHATPDVARTLAHVRRLLAPGGVLLALEGLRPQRFGDLTVGLTPGWWAFEDRALRSEYALLDENRWHRVLVETGYDDVRTLPASPAASRGALGQQAVLLARSTVGALPEPRRWIAVANADAPSGQFADELTVAGVAGTVLPPPQSAEAWADAVALAPGAGWIHLTALDERTAEDDTAAAALGRQRTVTGAAIGLARALAAAGHPTPLVLVTRAARRVTNADAVDPVGAPLWGLGRSIALEHAELECRMVDLPADEDPSSAPALAAILAGDAREDEIAIRGGHAWHARIAPLPPPATGGPAPGGAWIITGGLAGLGLRCARWLAAGGAQRLVLNARTSPGASHAEIDALRANGVEVEVVLGSIADPGVAEALVAAAHPVPLRGVLHAAGVTDDVAIVGLEWERTDRVMQAKVGGAWALHRATAGHELEHFVLFSSAAAFLGSPGQANHAAANAWLTALAEYRNARGLPALALDWGAWSDTGAAMRDGVLDRARAAGLAPIEPAVGLDLLGRLMAAGATHAAVVPVDWAAFLTHLPAGTRPAVFERVRAPAHPGAPPPTSESSGALARRWAAAGPRRRAVLAEDIAAAARRVLGLAPDQPLDPGTPLSEIGLDSLMAVELRNALARGVDRPLPATLLFNHPGIEELTAALAERLAADIPSVEAEAGEHAGELAPAGGAAMTEIDRLSEDEIVELLARKLGDG